MNATTDAQHLAISTGLQAIEYAELVGTPVPDAALKLVSNHDLLTWVFGTDEGPYRPILASFKGNPKSAPHSAWAPSAWWPDISVDRSDANNYLTLNRYEAMRGSGRPDWYFSRREMQARSMHGNMLDDLGEEWSELGLMPTWAIETSAGNYQSVYILDKALEGPDLMLGKALGQALIEKGWSDPNAGSPTTRFMRLPKGINGKADPAFQVRLVYFNPSNRYSVGELVNGLGLTLKALKPFVAPPPPERLRGSLGEIQELVERIDVQTMDRDHWIGFMHALRGAVGPSTMEGEALAVQASWNASEHEIAETLRAWRTLDTKGLRSGIAELRRLTRHPDPTTAFADLEDEDEGNDKSAAFMGATRRAAEEVVNAAKQKAEKKKFAQVRKLPPVDASTPYLVKSLMHQKSLTVIYGASGSAKTFIAVNMAVHLAAGIPWFGCRVKGKVGVIVLANEDSGGVQERMHAAARHLGLDMEKLPISITLTKASMTHSKEEVRERIKEMRAELKRDFPELRHFVVIFDTMLATWTGLDDNSAESIGQVLEDCAGVQDGGMSVVLIHHLGKDASKGMRGHSSLYAAADCALLVQFDPLARQFVMAITKRRRGVVGEEFAFELEIVGIGFDEDGEGLTTGVVKPVAAAGAAVDKAPLSDGQQLVLQALVKAIAAEGEVHNAGPVHGVHQATDIESWRDSYYEMRPRSTDQERNTSYRAFTRGSEQLLVRGIVGTDQGMYWAE